MSPQRVNSRLLSVRARLRPIPRSSRWLLCDELALEFDRRSAQGQRVDELVPPWKTCPDCLVERFAQLVQIVAAREATRQFADLGPVAALVVSFGVVGAISASPLLSAYAR
jgi:hypothetical protein